MTGIKAPSHSLPTWEECDLIIKNHEFRTRAREGLEGAVIDTAATTPEPTELHRFIHEYDIAGEPQSGWFMHRLENLVKELTGKTGAA